MRVLRTMLAVGLLASMVATGGAVAGVSESGHGFVPGELIVGLGPGANPQAIADALSGQVDRALLSGDAFVLRVAGNPHALAAVARVLPGVRYAEPNWIRVLHDHDNGLTRPNDTDFPSKWDLFNGVSLFDGSDTPTHGADINWLDAYNALELASFTSTKIAILDTGIDTSHPDLNGKLVAGWDFISSDPNPQDGFGHGTHVAGIAAAETNNATGTAGVGFPAEVKIMPIKVCDDSGQCPSDAIANGITFAAANGAKVINMSFGGTEISSAEQTAINNAHNAGVLMVASAGNSNVATQNFPAAYEPVMAIAATDWDDGKASYSNFGATWVDLAAPGGDMGTYDDPEGIYSTMPTYNVFLTSCRARGLLSPCYDLNYDQLAGTSMAAPQVAGAAGLLFAIGAGSNADIRSLIQNSAEAVSGTGTLWANGRLDIGAAVAAVGGIDTSPSVIITNPTADSTVSGVVTVTATATDDLGISRVEFFVDNVSIGLDNNGSDGWTAAWDTTASVDAVHTVSATATDTGAQTSSDSVSVTVDNIDDPPSISVTNPTADSTVSGVVTVTATATDDLGISRVEFFVDNVSIGLDNNGSDGWTAAWDTTASVDAVHTVSATATDTGAQTSSHSVSVTVDNTAPATMHVGDLDGGAIPNGPSWTASVTILVVESGGNAVAGATVSGSWSNGVGGSASCLTGLTGTCTVSKSGIPKRTGSVTFTVTGVNHGSLTYDATANTDHDLDSNGTSIIVSKP